MTQNKQILLDLMAGKTITPLDALKRYGCFRLGARIWELRRNGHSIKRRFVTKGGKTYAAYSMER